VFKGGEELRLANECMQAMIAENKGEVDLSKTENIEELIKRVEGFLGREIQNKKMFPKF
jgi:hypothetical protein